jgi:hypothetical protein
MVRVAIVAGKKAVTSPPNVATSRTSEEDTNAHCGAVGRKRVSTPVSCRFI